MNQRAYKKSRAKYDSTSESNTKSLSNNSGRKIFPPHKKSSDLFDLVGNTPLVDLKMFREEFPKSRVSAKLEYLNPGGSLKDRPVARIIRAALAEGKLTSEKTLLDSSSGNAGISYSLFGAALGVKVHLVAPGNASSERLERIRAHGASLTLTDPMEGYDEAIRTAHRIYEENPNKYFLADQYGNENNWRAHYETTGVEISLQAPEITHFVGGVGTGGSITGISRRLKTVRSDITIVCVRPERFPGIEGLKPLGEPDDIKPAIFDESSVDEWIPISAETAREYSHKLAREGFFVGHSSGAYLAAVKEILKDEPRAQIVTLLNDTGERYMSVGLWDGLSGWGRQSDGNTNEDSRNKN